MQHSTGYVLGFSAIVCVVCALFVAGSAVSLKERQDQNILVDRQKNVLAVAGLIQSGEKLTPAEVRKRFDESIRSVVIALTTGRKNDQVDPATYNQRAASKDETQSRRAPENASKVLRVPENGLIYEVVADGRIESIILPIEGMGLWSILYGYVAFEPDLNTVKGITFYSHGETAGLGGEVDNARWKALWPGRKAFDERGDVKIVVKKGPAGPPSEDPHQVDGLSGATLTSRGVTNMLHFWLGEDGFGPYIALQRKSGTQEGT